MRNSIRRPNVVRCVVGAMSLVIAMVLWAPRASAFELLPSLGVTKSTDTNAGDAKGFAGLAIRAPVLPFLKLEGGIAYRQDSFGGGDLTLRQWPVTASVWASPTPMLYAGGGLGWYRTTIDFREPGFNDRTTSKLGVHLGGGAGMPLTPNLGLDLNGRYIFMQQDDDSVELPTTFDPDFWNVSLGLAIRF